MGQSDGRGTLVRRRAEGAFRGIMVVFGVGFLVFALIGYIVTKEVGIVVMFVFIYALGMAIGLWGKRWIMRNIDHH